MDPLYIILAVGIGLLAGFGMGYLWMKGRMGLSREDTEMLRRENDELDRENTRLQERNQLLKNREGEMQGKLENERTRASNLQSQLAEMNADYRNLKEKLDTQKEELKNLQEAFKTQFENLANKILEEKTQKFTEQNKQNLDQLLNPLGKKIEEFKKKVEQTHIEETKERSSLREHLKHLAELNQQMSDETRNLTKALKGQTKTQGNWGEVILQRILEKSGLQKNREYFVQESFKTDDGRRLQPDVIVKLPDAKHLIIDSKVSLTAYERYVSSDDEAVQEKALKQHVESIRAHVKGLSSKNYQKLYDAESPDFVLMFIPIEPAFGLALQYDSSLYYEAFDRNIVIVSPSTLLATLATIDNVWKQEYQNRNALEIARQSGNLYDKFVGFAEDLQQIGMRIRQTQESYESAMNKLQTGRGNLIRRVEKIRKLGASASKKLPGEFINHDNNDDLTINDE